MKYSVIFIVVSFIAIGSIAACTKSDLRSNAAVPDDVYAAETMDGVNGWYVLKARSVGSQGCMGYFVPNAGYFPSDGSLPPGSVCFRDWQHATELLGRVPHGTKVEVPMHWWSGLSPDLLPFAPEEIPVAFRFLSP